MHSTDPGAVLLGVWSFRNWRAFSLPGLELLESLFAVVQQLGVGVACSLQSPFSRFIYTNTKK